MLYNLKTEVWVSGLNRRPTKSKDPARVPRVRISLLSPGTNRKKRFTIGMLDNASRNQQALPDAM